MAALQHRMASLAAPRESQLRWLVAAFESDPKSLQVCEELADVAMELGQFETALKALRAVVAMKESGSALRATAYLKQARIALLQCDGKRALFLAKKAESEDPSQVEVLEFIERLGAREQAR